MRTCTFWPFHTASPAIVSGAHIGRSAARGAAGLQRILRRSHILAYESLRLVHGCRVEVAQHDDRLAALRCESKAQRGLLRAVAHDGRHDLGTRDPVVRLVPREHHGILDAALVDGRARVRSPPLRGGNVEGEIGASSGPPGPTGSLAQLPSSSAKTAVRRSRECSPGVPRPGSAVRRSAPHIVSVLILSVALIRCFYFSFFCSFSVSFSAPAESERARLCTRLIERFAFYSFLYLPFALRGLYCSFTGRTEKP